MVQNDAVVAEAHVPAPDAPQWVVFRCGERRFVTPLEGIREILPPLAFTRIPGCGPEVCGLVGVRGRVLTVLDLGVILGMRPAAQTTDHRLLIVDHGDRAVGVVVDEVVATAYSSVEARGATALDHLEPEDVLGTCRVGEERHIALKLDGIIARLLA
jgi:purine-binding chemotaxis protein CheW